MSNQTALLANNGPKQVYILELSHRVFSIEHLTCTGQHCDVNNTVTLAHTIPVQCGMCNKEMFNFEYG